MPYVIYESINKRTNKISFYLLTYARVKLFPYILGLGGFFSWFSWFFFAKSQIPYLFKKNIFKMKHTLCKRQADIWTETCAKKSH